MIGEESELLSSKPLCRIGGKMSDGFVNPAGLKYILFCSIVWAIVLPFGSIIGVAVGELLFRHVTFRDWFPVIGLMFGASLGGAYTIRGLRQWIPDIDRKQILVTGIVWALALASVLIPSIIIPFD